MARSISNAKFLSSFLVDQLSVVARGSGVAMMKKGGEESKKSSTPWVPDPVTGYYKPESQTNQVDAEDMCELLLKQKTGRH